MLNFNVQYDDPKVIKQIRATALQNLVAGVTITQFISEGTQFQGMISCDTNEVLLATERFLDEYYGELITEIQPNFSSYQNIFYGQS